jgi:hypothetical protein
MAEDKQIELELDDNNDVEVEVKPENTETEEKSVQTEVVEEDQFKKAESSMQKRIDKLTKKMREAERREQEAINFAKNVQHESHTLKTRLNNLDTSYITEYDNRVKSQMAQAEKDLAKAMEIGDSQAAVVANKQIAELSVQNSQLNQAKAQQERQKQINQQQAYAPQPNQPVQQPQQIRRPDPKAEEWASKNDWFGQDDAMTFAAFGIHKRLVEEEGFDPQSDEYYTELDRRIEDKFNMSSKDTGRRPVQTVASVQRNSGRNSGKKVRLTPSQVAIAKKLGVPLEEYAKYVKE